MNIVLVRRLFAYNCRAEFVPVKANGTVLIPAGRIKINRLVADRIPEIFVDADPLHWLSGSRCVCGDARNSGRPDIVGATENEQDFKE